MDMSIVQEVEERINVNHVPDYVDDIFKYLREMEVKNFGWAWGKYVTCFSFSNLVNVVATILGLLPYPLMALSKEHIYGSCIKQRLVYTFSRI